MFSLNDNRTHWLGGEQKARSEPSHGVYRAGNRNLLARWPVAGGGRTLGTIGRDRAALVREEWMGLNEPLPAGKEQKQMHQPTPSERTTGAVERFLSSHSHGS